MQSPGFHVNKMEDVRFIAEAKMTEPVAGIDAEEENESLSPTQREPPTARKLLLQNATLRRNFEHLKQLFMKLSKANQSLQETCRRLQSEKDQGHGGDMILETDEHTTIFPNKGKDIFTKEIEVMRLERDQAIAEKEAVELEYIKLVSMKGEEREKAGDLADKESKLLKEDLEKARKDLKLAKETILKSQKEITEMHEEAAGLRAQLQDALNDARLYQQNGVDCMHANEQLRQSLLGAQENIAELIKARKDDEIFHLQQLKDSQMGWELERTRLLETVNKDSAQRIAKLTKQNHVLRKRLKQSYHVLAAMTCDCNRLKDELSAKAMVWKEEERMPEEAPTKKVATLERESAHYGPCLERGDVVTQYQNRTWPLYQDMTHLARRQMKLLDSLVAT